ncbi:hypothetical protein SUGI_0577470 [Cryptomeria japonica]|uniref:uncharacterized protein LOC131035742 n=1 Tax=Cryptomeria japonica TaxID=3369 RepID=UPI002408C786|nr:uncharacterized protein LOC131035742 [Cryptomeria japonica]GLJ29285.1 hypothetical protein SUGI_0577470 [Cryptomeria japonica]
MVGSTVAVKKLWKSLLTSVTTSRRVVKQKLKKKRFGIGSAKRRREKYGHYNFSDDDETTSRFRKRLRKWKIKGMSCLNGRADIESGNAQFVYVTDLYRPPSSFTVDCHDPGVKSEEPRKGIQDALFMPHTQNNTFGRSGDVKMKAAECSSSRGTVSSSKTELKGLCCEESEKGRRKKIDMSEFGEEVDSDAELFIAKFYDQIRLQRQKSIVEYGQMLDRGTSSS